MSTRTGAARAAEDCDHLLGAYLAAGDLEAIVELYEPGAAFVTQDREVKVGRDAIRQAFADLAALKPRLRSNVFMTLRNGENLAVLYNDWTMSVRTPDGQTQEMTGKAIEVVCRQSDGSWKFAVDDPFARM
jgi:uncharacterized protein (TIGR02246 family)